MLVPPADLVAVAKATITECSVANAHECVSADTLIVDIREPAEYHRGHLPGALHLPRGLLEFEIHAAVRQACADENLADAERPILLYCGTGGRSALAAFTLEAMGYKNVRSMAGGMVAWVAAHLPVELPR